MTKITEVTETIYVLDLEIGDVFPSHDDLTHTVTRITEGNSTLFARVEKSSGEQYTAELHIDDKVGVLR